MTLSTDFVYNMMQSDKAWKIKDIAKLIMAVNRIIEIKEPSGKKVGKKVAIQNQQRLLKRIVRMK